MNGDTAYQNDQFAVLNQIRDLDRGIDENQRNVSRIEMLQKRALNDADSRQETPINREIDQLSATTNATYKNFVERMKKIKNTAGAGDPQNSSQITRIDKKLRDAMQAYVESQQRCRKSMQEQTARQMRNVNPQVTDQEIQRVLEDPNNNQIYAQAVSLSLTYAALLPDRYPRH